MSIDVRQRFSRIVYAPALAAALAGLNALGWGQDNPLPNTNPNQQNATNQTPRDGEAREKVQSARETTRETIQESREHARDSREGARDAREKTRDTRAEAREGSRDARETSRDAARDDRESIRDARRDLRQARREFRAERIRSGDVGLWLQRAIDGLTVANLSSRGAIAKTGLQEGDEIVSVNGKHVASEREFMDALFADQQNNKAVQVVVKRKGQQQTVSIDTNSLVDEHLASDQGLHEYGIILDDDNAEQLKVQAVVPRSPAFYAGMRAGDQITALRGQRVAAVAELIRGLASNAGGTAAVDVNRNNQPRRLEMDIPGNRESRTALRPTYPATPPSAPQGQNSTNRTNPPRQPFRSPQPQPQPRPNPPR